MDDKEKLPEILITPYQETPGATPVQEGETRAPDPSQPAQEEIPAKNLETPTLETTPTAIPAAKQPSSITKPVFGSLAACLTCGCVGIPVFIFTTLVVLLLVDPLNLHVWGRVNGKYDAAAEVMPADTGIYLGINIGNALLTRVDRVVGPMTASNQSDAMSMFGNYHALFAPSDARQASIIDDLLQQVLDESGVKIPDDVSPWIGQYAGVGVVNTEADNYSSTQSPLFLFALEARNNKRADAFLETLQGNLTALQGMKFRMESYMGTKMYVEVVTGSGDALAFGRDGRMVLIAADVSLLKKAIDGHGKFSLDQQSDYANLIDERSRGWSMSIYLSEKNYSDLIESMMQQDSGLTLMLYNLAFKPTWTSMLLNATVINNGIRFDMYSTMNESTQSTTNTGQTINENQSSASIIQLLPQDTVVYLALPRFDMMVPNLLSLAFVDSTDPSVLYDSFEEYFGFSLTDDFLSHLNGQWVIYVVPSSQGLLPQQTDLDLAVNLLVEANNQLDLAMISSKLAQIGEDAGLDIVPNQLGGVTYYQVNESWSNTPMLVFGQSDGYFGLGTDIDVLQASFTNETPLVKSADYLAAINNLPAGMQPFGFMDLESMFASLREGMSSDEIQSFNDSVGVLDQISSIVMASQVLPNNMNYNSIVVNLQDQ